MGFIANKKVIMKETIEVLESVAEEMSKELDEINLLTDFDHSLYLAKQIDCLREAISILKKQ